LACQADHLGRLGAAAAPYPQAELWQRAAGAFRSIDAGAVARACATPAQIPAALHQARVAAVRAALGSAATP
jgi:tRNA nucleotidyltransferase (CCA-adding enzyme)